ncbi:uncharacterized protein LOC127276936 [Leptopilina boulardi]|uniref:uncharacterized protein LOC127276936 n=1 Tax=Leptopilina boulardi TaxID=63433 RepID=UPI0021F60506|nr:uncharacterized protein LOC127276936 [Leptopilina boulardi]
MGGSFVIGGDFDAKAPDWGMDKLDARGLCILEMAARTGLVIANQGNTSTFRRPGYAETIPDITLISEKLSGDVKNWSVIENYTGSDHQYITFDVSKIKNSPTKEDNRAPRWNIDKLNEEKFRKAIIDGSNEIAIMGNTKNLQKLTKDTIHVLQKACNISMPNKHGNKRRRPVYWWTKEITDIRKNCLRLRCQATRQQKRKPGETSLEKAEYKKAKRRLSKAIKRSKKDRWEELTQDINNNP